MVRYFVSYTSGGRFGNSDVSVPGKIKSGEDVEMIADRIAEEIGIDKVIIVFYSELSENS